MIIIVLVINVYVLTDTDIKNILRISNRIRKLQKKLEFNFVAHQLETMLNDTELADIYVVYFCCVSS